VVAETSVVEQHAGDHERPRERPAPRFVGTRNHARAKLAVESQELLAGASDGPHGRGG
jgi:hypothetical protein